MLAPGARFLPVPDTLKAALAPAELCLFEWNDLFFQFPNAQKLWFGPREATLIAPGIFRVRFENALGLCPIRAESEEPFWVEVLSPKFPTPESHFRFLQNLLADLTRFSDSLVWHFQTPTSRGFLPRRATPGALETLDFLRNHGEFLGVLLAQIAAHPPHRLRKTHSIVPVSLAASLDETSLFSVFGASDWQKISVSRAPRGWNGDYFPSQIAQTSRSFESGGPEISLAVSLCRTVLRVASQEPFSRLLAAISEAQQTQISSILRAMRGFLSRFSSAQTVKNSEKPRSFAARQLARLQRELCANRSPIFAPVERFTQVRDIASLWEFWTFFALVESIENALSQRARLEAEFDPIRGLFVPSRAVWDEFSLVFNGPAPSYSTPLRPDFLWFRGAKPLVAFDAKFRTDSENSARGQGADLHKMHAYCDALGVGAALALHPGTQTTFFDRARGPLSQIPLRAALEGAALGVGLWGARPASSV